MPTLLLTAAALLAASPPPALSAQEQRYVEARAAAAVRFGQPSTDGQAEAKALADLRSRLHAIVGQVRLPGLDGGEGRLAYDGFWGVCSTEMEDGLTFEWGKATLFVTSRALHLRALAMPSPGAADEPMVFGTVICDAAFGVFTEVPVSHHAPTRRARAVLGLGYQDYTSSPPDTLVVEVEREGRIYVVAATPAALEPVRECAVRFDADWKKVPNDAADKDRREAQVFKAYRECAAPVIASRPAFAAVVRQAQGIVDRLEAVQGSGLQAP